MKRIFGLLFIFFCTVSCGWETPIKIDGATSNYTHGIFMDESSGNTYIFYGKNTYNSSNIFSYVCFKIYSYDNKEVKESCIRQKQYIESISADGQGNNIYVLFNAKRRKGGVKCDQSSTDGCYDVFFMETKDGGEKWTSPIQIPHPSREDISHRKSPQILFVKETGRIFVTYIQRSSSYYYLRYSTRAKDSAVFQEEMQITSFYSIVENIHLVYRHRMKELTVQLYFQYQDKLMYANTVNNGAQWTIRERQQLSQKGSYKVAISHDEERAFLVTSDANKLVVSWEEADLSWHSRTYTQSNVPDGYCPILASVPEQNQHMMFTASMDLTKANTYSFDTEFEELFDLKDASPLCSKHGSVSFTFNKVYKAHFLAASGEDMVLLTYTFVSKGTK